MDDQSKEFIESSEAVEREEYERRRIQRAARSRSGSVKSTSTKLGAEKLTPEGQRPKPAGRKAEPLSPAEQRRRFDELSRELGTDNGETLDAVFEKIVPAKVRDEKG